MRCARVLLGWHRLAGAGRSKVAAEVDLATAADLAPRKGRGCCSPAERTWRTTTAGPCHDCSPKRLSCVGGAGSTDDGYGPDGSAMRTARSEEAEARAVATVADLESRLTAAVARSGSIRQYAGLDAGASQRSATACDRCTWPPSSGSTHSGHLRSTGQACSQPSLRIRLPEPWREPAPERRWILAC